MIFLVENLKDGILKTKNPVRSQKNVCQHCTHFLKVYYYAPTFEKVISMRHIYCFCPIKGYLQIFVIAVLEDVDLLGFLSVVCLFAAFLPNSLTLKAFICP